MQVSKMTENISSTCTVTKTTTTTMTNSMFNTSSCEDSAESKQVMTKMMTSTRSEVVTEKAHSNEHETSNMLNEVDVTLSFQNDVTSSKDTEDLTDDLNDLLLGLGVKKLDMKADDDGFDFDSPKQETVSSSAANVTEDRSNEFEFESVKVQNTSVSFFFYYFCCLFTACSSPQKVCVIL